MKLSNSGAVVELLTAARSRIEFPGHWIRLQMHGRGRDARGRFSYAHCALGALYAARPWCYEAAREAEKYLTQATHEFPDAPHNVFWFNDCYADHGTILKLYDIAIGMAETDWLSNDTKEQ